MAINVLRYKSNLIGQAEPRPLSLQPHASCRNTTSAMAMTAKHTMNGIIFQDIKLCNHTSTVRDTTTVVR